MTGHGQRMTARQGDGNRFFAFAWVATQLRTRAMPTREHSGARLFASIQRVFCIIGMAEAGTCVTALETARARHQASTVMVPLDVISRRTLHHVAVLLAAQPYVGADETFRAYYRQYLSIH